MVTAVEQRVVRSTAGEHRYDHLVLATGSEPVVLRGQRESATAHVLRTRADAARIRAALRPGARIVVVGAGWIGAEVATAAVRQGCDVTVVDSAATPLANALPAAIGDRTVPWYRGAGVTLRWGTAVDRITPTGLLLDDGAELAADAVVVGVGARPATSYLANNGVGVRTHRDGAVVVDARLRAAASNVYAIGDIASWPSSRFGTLRTEHWDHAAQSGAHVARAILGDARAYDPVPYVWSDQWGRCLQLVGHPVADAELVVDEGDGPDRWVAWWTSGGRLVAALAVNQPRLIRAARRSIERGDAVGAPAAAAGHPWSER
ncbi:NAD(P)/FAD-dependent oxidoreductase [Pimelobacter simplex]|uniref:NAD(P)/FAD-dependent oxidoreductase n=1 Tax=Nocardioides simplex TaxID=2045 RepID=A0A7J5DYD2_NOCSI|nr:FAD/NAD(P)-binding oxidoreductase [Pimelobacter simplex]KAB2810927.1 NAD(P)/FAD-dependent oxidoreductase [Pimelobacter simplex]